MYYKASMFNNIALSIIQDSYVHFDVNIKMNVNIGCDHVRLQQVQGSLNLSLSDAPKPKTYPVLFPEKSFRCATN